MEVEEEEEEEESENNNDQRINYGDFIYEDLDMNVEDSSEEGKGIDEGDDIVSGGVSSQ